MRKNWRETMKSRVNFFVSGVLAILITVTGAGIVSAMGMQGSTFIGLGCASSQMGGTGTAMPLDSIAATMRNPAGLSFFDRPAADLEFGHARDTSTGYYVYPDELGGPWHGSCDERNYPMMAVGVAIPLKNSERFKDIPLTLGVGLGVTAGAGAKWNKVCPLNFCALYLMNSGVVCLSYKVNNFSFGIGPRLNFGTLDLGYGHAVDEGWGIQAGIIYSKQDWSFGASYISGISIDYRRIIDLDGDGSLDDLEFEEPQQTYFGVSYNGIDKWILNLEGRWINYGGAALYSDCDWKDLWAVSLGAQYEILPNLKLRAGYLYNNSQIKINNGFDINGTRDFQGHQISEAVFEAWHHASLPLYFNHHLGCGIAYDFIEGVTFSLGLMWDLKEGISMKDSTGMYSIDHDIGLFWVDTGISVRF